MKTKHLRLIAEGLKTTTLRSLIYANYPFEKRKIKVPYELTPEIIKSEGYQTKEELIAELKSLKHKLPKEFWLYFLNKPLKLKNFGDHLEGDGSSSGGGY